VYQLSGKDTLYEWLAKESDSENRELMLAWLAQLAEDPLRYGHRVPGNPAPIYLAVTPVRRWTIKFLLAEQFKTIHIIGFDPLE
jgi:hypothetical protein